MDNNLMILLVVAVGILAIVILGLGVLSLFGYASTQGFIGIIVFFAAWVFMWPVMLGLSAILGIIASIEWLREPF